MQANIESIGALERRLGVSVPRDSVVAEMEARLKRLARTVKMHGFRPGKVPMEVVSRQYGSQVRQEVLGDMLQKGFNEAVRDQKLRVAGYPRFEPKQTAENTSDFEFNATFEVYPDVVLGDLSQIGIELPVSTVSPADVDKTIGILLKQRVRYELIERPAITGDRINIDYSGKIDGVEFAGGKAEKFVVVLGEGRLLPDFENVIPGMSAGQEKTFKMVFPADYHGKEVAGKTAVFDLKLNSVEEAVLPQVGEEFARSLGIEDGDTAKMRSEIQENLEREVARRIKAKVKEQVMQMLLDNAPVTAPKALVDMEVKQLMDNARKDLQSRGVRAEDITLSPEYFNKQAERRVSLGIILGDLVKTHDLRAKPEQVRTVVEDFAQGYENPDEVIKWHFAASERLNEAESIVMEDNVVEWVLAKVEKKNKEVTFNELMGKS